MRGGEILFALFGDGVRLSHQKLREGSFMSWTKIPRRGTIQQGGGREKENRIKAKNTTSRINRMKLLQRGRTIGSHQPELSGEKRVLDWGEKKSEKARKGKEKRIVLLICDLSVEVPHPFALEIRKRSPCATQAEEEGDRIWGESSDAAGSIQEKHVDSVNTTRRDACLRQSTR